MTIADIKNMFTDPTKDILRKKKALNRSASLAWYVLRIIILLAIGYIIIYPLFYMIATSLRSRQSYYDSARVWIPSSVTIDFNYSEAWKFIKYPEGLANTVILEIIAGLIEVVTCSIVAYGFARFKFKLKPLFTAGLFLTILVPEIMVIIPRMVTYSKMDILGIFGLLADLTNGAVDLRPNLIGSPLAFYLPSLFAMGLRSGILIYIYIQFFKGLPYELEEAAWVDGAGPVKTFVSIALPSSSVVFTTVTVFSMIWHWNDTFLASMYVDSNFPLSVHLNRINQTLIAAAYYPHDPETQSFLMAACFLFILPPLIFYMFMQRKFIESIDRVGITG
ncbi:MAG: carbohydrate ABC transporter permease [Clostridia bacterium]|nr:carbohydrate ABC transporter permease [Clostridia bacterium]